MFISLPIVTLSLISQNWALALFWCGVEVFNVWLWSNSKTARKKLERTAQINGW
jgi:hypothetical protein